LLDQRGSTVLRGDVQLLPIENSLIYVRPIWLKAESGPSFPRFRYVAMTLGDERAVLADTVAEGVDALFRGGPTVPADANPNQPTEPDEPAQPDEPAEPEQPSGTIEGLLQQAQREFNEANDALREGDLGGYEDHVNAARDLIDTALRQANSSGTSTSTTATTAGAATTTTTRPTTTSTGP
jgi:uncharacterized membrane protein (UPF0182 family)